MRNFRSLLIWVRSTVPRIVRTSFYLVIAGVVASYAASATAAEVVSNLSQPSDSTYTADYEGPEAEAFTTDGAAYFLQSVTVDVDSVEDSSGNFTLRIFTDDGGLPGTMVPNGLLSGPGNPSTGLNTYSAAGTINLYPNTTYWVVAQVSSGSGAYALSFTDSTSQTGSWTIEDWEAYSSDYGSTWDTDSGVMRMSISASLSTGSIPTLSEWGLILLLLSLATFAFLLLRRRDVTVG